MNICFSDVVFINWLYHFAAFYQHFFYSFGVSKFVVVTFNVGQPAQVAFDMQCFLASATPTDEANPAVTQTDEPLVIVSCANILTVGGTTVKADSVTITPNNTIEKFYTIGGTNGLKDMEILDNGFTLTATFFAESGTFGADYALLESQAAQSIEIKLGTNSSSALVNGKSIHIECGNAEVQSVQDSSDKDRVKRTVTYRLNNDSADADKAMKITYGTFA